MANEEARPDFANLTPKHLFKDGSQMRGRDATSCGWAQTVEPANGDNRSPHSGLNLGAGIARGTETAEGQTLANMHLRFPGNSGEAGVLKFTHLPAEKQ